MSPDDDLMSAPKILGALSALGSNGSNPRREEFESAPLLGDGDGGRYRATAMPSVPEDLCTQPCGIWELCRNSFVVTKYR